MKKIITLITLIFVMSTFCSIAQPKVEHLSNKNSFKGKRELRRENRVHDATDNLAERNERKARRKNNLGTLSNYKVNKKEITRERKKKKKEESKTKETIAKTKNKEDSSSE